MALLGVSVWRRALGVDRATVIEEIDFDEESETVVVHVRPRRSTKRHCGRCALRAPLYDRGEGRRKWRTLDLGTLICHLEAESPRVNCPVHGPTVAVSSGVLAGIDPLRRQIRRGRPEDLAEIGPDPLLAGR
jgi:hypothetical protein